MTQVKEEAPLTRAERQAQREETELREIEEVRRLSRENPELYEDYERLRRQRAEADDTLPFLLKKMIIGPDWLWQGVRGDLSQYTKEEQEKINYSGGLYYQEVEYLYRADESVNANEEELLGLIRELDVDTNQREDSILNPLFKGENHHELVIEWMYKPLAKTLIPRRLRY